MEVPGEVSEASLHEFERFLKVNVTGTFLAVRAQSKAMKGQEPLHSPDPLRTLGRGVIINMGSGNSYVATPHIVQYTASKHAVLGITRNAGMFSDNNQLGHLPAKLTFEFSTRQCTLRDTSELSLSIMGEGAYDRPSYCRKPSFGRVYEECITNWANCATGGDFGCYNVPEQSSFELCNRGGLDSRWGRNITNAHLNLKTFL